MNLIDYRPRSALVTNQSVIVRPKFPVIDAHNHLSNAYIEGQTEIFPIPRLLETLDQARIIHIVDLDGGWGEEILNEHLKIFKEAAPEKFTLFGGVNWSAWEEKGNAFPEWAAERLRQQAARGAGGLKIWKNFGLHVHDQHQNLVAVDDTRLDPIWQTAGELHLPVMIHVADPIAFFDPLDEFNERWEELHAHPDWHFPSPPFPRFLDILNGLSSLVERHPYTTFIGAHVGCYAENLAWVGNLLDRCPNFFVDIGARIGELGRQPFTARKFFLKYPDRILFSTDASPDLETYQIYYRFLESEDEYFNYNPGEIPYQGRWFIYGLNLPDDVLEMVYICNARKVFALNDLPGEF